MAGTRFDAVVTADRADQVRAAIIGALRAGADAAGESYSFGQPRTDAFTYGTDLWRFVCYEMADKLGALPEVSVCYPRGSFLVDLGSAVLYPFRYGEDLTDDVRSARLHDSHFRRELLVDPRTEQYLFWPTVVLIAYAANPQDGLVRTYLGSARIQGSDLLDWEWLEEVSLDASTTHASDSQGSGTPPLPLPLPRTGSEAAILEPALDDA